MATTDRNDSIRKEVLFQHYALKSVPLGAAQIERECRKNAMDFTRAEIAEAQQFLCDDGLIVEAKPPGTTARLYRINSNGVRHYEQTYAA